MKFLFITNPAITILLLLNLLIAGAAIYFYKQFIKIKRANEEEIQKNINTNAFMELLMGVMSHEVRTPLNAIIGFSEQLLKSESYRTNFNFIVNIRNCAEQLINVFNNILVFSYKENENLAQDKVAFSGAKIIQETSSIFSPKAKEKNISLQTHIDNISDDILLGDCDSLKQLIFNLLDGCLKFTLSGFIKTNYKFKRINTKRIDFTGSISVSGIRISVDEITNAFHQIPLNTKASKNFEDTPWNFFLVNKIIEKQNGQINVYTNGGLGLSISFNIPFESLTTEEVNKVNLWIKKADILKGKRFLIADDDEFNRLLAKKRLETWGANVEMSKNGTETLLALSKSKFDIVLLDIQMPDISGVEVASILREQWDNINNKTPVIAVTATVKDKETIKLFNNSGINEWLIKPYKENALFEKIIMLLSSTSEDPNQIYTMNTTMNPQKHYDLEVLKSITKGDSEFLLLMLNTFLNNNKEHIDILEQAYHEQNWNTISNVAHKMLNSYRQLQISELIPELEDLESISYDNNVDKNKIKGQINKITTYSRKIFEDLEKETAEIV